jgi:putative flippase GtrA
MVNLRSVDEWRRLWRYYQAGIVNMLFGLAVYSGFVKLGLNVYLAQLLAHILGVAFNYFTYSRHTFSDMDGSRSRFILSYGGNYLLSLATLAFFEQFIESPYVSGLLTILFVSAVNYLVLRKFVFKLRPGG